MEELQNSCAFTGHRPHKLPYRDDVNDPRYIMITTASTRAGPLPRFAAPVSWTGKSSS